jgi:4-hydroxybutyrate CoA-transferase
VLASLSGHKHLGIHTEMWSDGALALIKSGVVDDSRKHVHPGKTVSGFVMGTRALYDFIDDNPSVAQLDIAYVNNAAVIARNEKVVAINSAVEVDLTGQICADSIRHRVISGVGGQMDFMRGASLSKGGRPIIAITSRTAKGHPRIVLTLRAGAGVVTTRAHVHYVITEHGVADLYGKTLSERAQALIAIAHPGDREQLEKGGTRPPIEGGASTRRKPAVNDRRGCSSAARARALSRRGHLCPRHRTGPKRCVSRRPHR